MLTPQTVLILESLLMAGLICGVVLARLKRFSAHGWMQGTIVTVNLIPILMVMLQTFRRQGLTGTLPKVHAVAGAVTELLGLYIMISAGLGWLPKALRFDNYKPWMRTAFGLWLVTFALGVLTYRVYNVAGPSVPAVGAQDKAGGPKVTIKNFQFDPKELTVTVGTEVEWMDEGGRHTVWSDDGSFKSEALAAGGTFKHKFDKAGTFRYYCDFHGSKGGRDMAGTVVVRAK